MTRSIRAARAVLPVGVALFVLLAPGALGVVSHAQQPVFRRTVELIAVDVQVIDGTGNPVAKLAPEAFDVSINGKHRRVVSAQFIRQGAAPEPEMRPASTSESVAPAPPAVEEPPSARTVIIAVDSGSFEPGDTQPAIEAARQFLKQLGPDDLVGLYTYPTRNWIEPSTMRAPIGVRLSNVVGEKQPLRSYYNLKPHEIVDITAQSTNPNSFLTASRQGPSQNATSAMRALDPVLMIQSRECPEDIDCPSKIYGEGLSLATQLEREVQLSLNGLESLLRTLTAIPGRKSVVLVTAGLLVSDRLDGRPDPGNVARVMGQAAARANATVYTIHITSGTANTMTAAKKGNGSTDLIRDRGMLGNWLEDFSRSAGGKRIDVPVGGGQFAFDRVLRETSAFYLLGVEPAEADRDGQPRELKVKVDRRSVTVRNRQWVVIPPKAGT